MIGLILLVPSNIYIYTYNILYTYHIYIYIYVHQVLEGMERNVHIYILGYIKGMIRIYETHVFFSSTIFQIPRRCWEDNDYVYALFYSAKGRLNIDIRAKFEQLAREWKWSRIHFGRIDVDKDWG